LKTSEVRTLLNSNSNLVTSLIYISHIVMLTAATTLCRRHLMSSRMVQFVVREDAYIQLGFILFYLSVIFSEVKFSKLSSHVAHMTVNCHVWPWVRWLILLNGRWHSS